MVDSWPSLPTLHASHPLWLTADLVCSFFHNNNLPSLILYGRQLNFFAHFPTTMTCPVSPFMVDSWPCLPIFPQRPALSHPLWLTVDRVCPFSHNNDLSCLTLHGWQLTVSVHFFHSNGLPSLILHGWQLTMSVHSSITITCTLSSFMVDSWPCLSIFSTTMTCPLSSFMVDSWPCLSIFPQQ